jgi:fumarylacetoacetate (FAA) hydrolase
VKLVSFATSNDPEHIGILTGNQIVDLQRAARSLNLDLPGRMAEFLAGEDRAMETAHKISLQRSSDPSFLLPLDQVRLLAPVPHPTSVRDGYAFRQHVATARRNRGVEMIPEFDQFPVFYFTNHQSIVGPGEVPVEKDHLEQLDFELEAAVVIGKHGRNIRAKDADQCIAGLMIMNDLSARVLQMDEMKLSLGPAKGKDFATAIGPWLVTPDELQSNLVSTENGNRYDLRMTAYHNGALVSDGNLKDMNWTFAEIIERASYGVELRPGDVIGSGTVGTGCYLELNGTRALEAKARGDRYSPVWLQAGDTIDLEITGLGRLSNKIVRAPGDYSILALKRQIPIA